VVILVVKLGVKLFIARAVLVKVGVLSVKLALTETSIFLSNNCPAVARVRL
jgi:hypothetical protein